MLSYGAGTASVIGDLVRDSLRLRLAERSRSVAFEILDEMLLLSGMLRPRLWPLLEGGIGGAMTGTVLSTGAATGGWSSSSMTISIIPGLTDDTSA
jgi:hypothetical protein